MRINLSSFSKVFNYGITRKILLILSQVDDTTRRNVGFLEHATTLGE